MLLVSLNFPDISQIYTFINNVQEHELVNCDCKPQRCQTYEFFHLEKGIGLICSHLICIDNYLRPDVLVCWGCQYKIPQTGWLRQQKSVSSPFWRLEFKTKMLASLFSSEASFLVSQRATFSLDLCFLRKREGDILKEKHLNWKRLF